MRDSRSRLVASNHLEGICFGGIVRLVADYLTTSKKFVVMKENRKKVGGPVVSLYQLPMLLNQNDYLIHTPLETSAFSWGGSNWI
jgi:hypothetical protein